MYFRASYTCRPPYLNDKVNYRDDSNPLVVSLDVIWGAISSSSIVTGADPDDDEDPIEHYLYDNSDLTGLMGAYWDLQGVLEIMFGELGGRFGLRCLHGESFD